MGYSTRSAPETDEEASPEPLGATVPVDGVHWERAARLRRIGTR